MMRWLYRLTTVERVVLVLIVGIVVLIAFTANAGLSAARTPDERSEFLCVMNGGVPARNEQGRYIRCDFPVRVVR